MQFKLLRLGAAVVLGATIASTAISETVPQVGTTADSSHVFLNFSHGKSNLISAAAAADYMKTIDPGNSAQNFKTWLVQAGFIGQESDWTPNGQQIVTHQTSLANANPAVDYGYNKINAFAHIIILNSADLGFIRNQYIRCKPDCLTPNAQIFTYLENYGPTQFAQLLKSGDIDPDTGQTVLAYKVGTGNKNFSTTNTREAVTIALERRATDPRAGGRIADVAFEWAPAANGTNPTHNFGKMYAYFVAAQEPVPFDPNNQTECNLSQGVNTVVSAPRNPSPTATIDESYFWPDDSGSPGNNQGVWDCKFNLRSLALLPSSDPFRIGFFNPRPSPLVKTGDPFAAELDKLGTKQMPSLCSICHGGNIPADVATNPHPWGTTGEVKEFKHLPADAVNSIFGCDDRSGASAADSCKSAHFQTPITPTSPLVVDGTSVTTASNMTRSSQEIELKKYNQAVLITQGANPPKAGFFDSNGVITGGPWTFSSTGSGTQKRPAQAGVEVILGWYADRNNLADATMSGVAYPNPTCAVDPTTGLPHPDCNELVLQNDGFVPVGWRGATSTGPAQPAGSHVTPSDLYLNMFAHDCRSCHLNREPSLQLATEPQFVAEKGNIQDYVFQPQCDFIHHQINPNNIVMPLARITWERLWNGINVFTNVANDSPSGSTVVSAVDHTTVVPNPDASTSVTDLSSPINKLKAYFGQTPTSYCKHH